MPVVLNAGVSTSTMTTISSRSDSTITYSTISSSVVNNSDVSSSSTLKQETAPATKYIQLQTVRPQHLNANMPVTVPATTLSSQRTTNNVVTPATNVQRPVQTGLPPGSLHFLKTSLKYLR